MSSVQVSQRAVMRVALEVQIRGSSDAARKRAGAVYRTIALRSAVAQASSG
jgi:hypothetical protein